MTTLDIINPIKAALLSVQQRSIRANLSAASHRIITLQVSVPSGNGHMDEFLCLLASSESQPVGGLSDTQVSDLDR